MNPKYDLSLLIIPAFWCLQVGIMVYIGTDTKGGVSAGFACFGLFMLGRELVEYHAKLTK